MLKCFCFLLPFLMTISPDLSAQPQKSTLTARIISIETRLLIDTTNGKFSASYVDALKVNVAYFEVVKRKGKPKHRPKNYIVIELGHTDHGCTYNFVVGNVYTFPAVVSKYPNSDIRMFKNWHYRLDCDQLPSLIQ